MSEREKLYDDVSEALTDYENATTGTEVEDAIRGMYHTLIDVQDYFARHGVKGED